MVGWDRKELKGIYMQTYTNGLESLEVIGTQLYYVLNKFLGRVEHLLIGNERNKNKLEV